MVTDTETFLILTSPFFIHAHSHSKTWSLTVSLLQFSYLTHTDVVYTTAFQMIKKRKRVKRIDFFFFFINHRFIISADHHDSTEAQYRLKSRSMSDFSLTLLWLFKFPSNYIKYVFLFKAKIYNNSPLPHPLPHTHLTFWCEILRAYLKKYSKPNKRDHLVSWIFFLLNLINANVYLRKSVLKKSVSPNLSHFYWKKTICLFFFSMLVNNCSARNEIKEGKKNIFTKTELLIGISVNKIHLLCNFFL